MGVVYTARASRLGRIVALKFLPPQWSHDESAKQRFVREAQAASATNHPNICTIHDIETADDGQLFIVMAYYDGQTLKKRLESGPLPIEEALDIATQVSEGLAKARAQWPGLRIDGAHGFFSIAPGSPEAMEMVRRVNEFAPDILFLGMGMPRQEQFAYRFGPKLRVPVIGLGGAAFAYFAGFEPTPPRWMGRIGLEWLYRLAASPRRLAFRYLIEPALLAFFLARRATRTPVLSQSSRHER